MFTEPPTAPPDVQALGRRLYCDLAAVISSHLDYFGEGFPHEWLTALERIQRVVTDSRQRAQQAQAAREADTEQRQGRLL